VKKSLKPTRVYSQNALAPGDLLFIVGNSFGLKNGISISVFSGKREGEDYFQLGNTVLPGHSGAGVFNSKGEFVGIVSFTLGTSVFYAQPGKGAVLKKEFRLGISPDIGISAGFGGPGVVIPQNKVIELSKEIIRSGKIERGWLGVFIDEKDGVVIVKEIVDDSPAQVGGIEKGDKILEYGNKQVKDLLDFVRMVKETKPGTKVSIGIERDKKNIDIEVNIAKRPNEEKLFRFKEIISPFKMFFEKTELERLKKEIEKLKEELKK
jgi:serine protease Do